MYVGLRKLARTTADGLTRFTIGTRVSGPKFTPANRFRRNLLPPIARARARLVLRKFPTSLLPSFSLSFLSCAFSSDAAGRNASAFEGRDRFAAAGRVSRACTSPSIDFSESSLDIWTVREKARVPSTWRREGRRTRRSRNEIVTFRDSYIAGDGETACSDRWRSGSIVIDDRRERNDSILSSIVYCFGCWNNNCTNSYTRFEIRRRRFTNRELLSSRSILRNTLRSLREEPH